jgi:hypothetical protein
VPTGIIQLPVSGAYLPDGSSGNLAARPQYVKSSGGPTSGTPNVFNVGLALTWQTAKEHFFFQNVWPHDLNTTGLVVTLRVRGYINATSSTVRLSFGQATSIDSSTDDTAVVFAAEDQTGAITVPSTARQPFEITGTFTTTNIAADRKYVIFISRVLAGATADWIYEGGELEYTT